jgi:ABC-2 type transport system permease protein
MSATRASTGPAASGPPATPGGDRAAIPLHPSVITEVLQLTGRNLRKITREPTLVFFSLAMPIIMLTLFGQVFRSIAQTPDFPKGVSYIDYLLPAVICTTLVQSATTSSTAIAADLEAGMIDRFRSMPIHAWTVLLARNISDVLRGLTQGLIMLALGMIVFGFRFHGTATESVAALLVAIPLSFAMNWAFIWLGIAVKKPETTQIAGMLVTFPLMFASSAYVPIASLPGWLQALAKVNPLSYTVDASRSLALGNGWSGATGSSLLIAAGLATVSILGASLLYRRMDR